jgi:probable H4MPT-linked C1 transfer pathway protein
MTGELCDHFPDRIVGVQRILEVMVRRLGATLLVHGRAGFLAPEAAAQAPLEVASMNWLATLRVTAAQGGSGWLLDMGTTTTDVLAWHEGAPAVRAWQDGDRLASGELVYTGVCRTPLMAVARRVPYRDGWRGVAAEYFANMADVYRITGELPEGADNFPTADGRPGDRFHSLARLARMVGEDFDAEKSSELEKLADYFAACQRREITEIMGERESGLGNECAKKILVGTGAGTFVTAHIAGALGVLFQDFATLMKVPPALGFVANVCAPAVAVARLSLAEAQR